MEEWECWRREWENAYNFFRSKGNVHTRSRLKAKWHREFLDMLKRGNEKKQGAEE